MRIVNVITCEPDETFGRGAFHARVFDLTERLGAKVIGATVFEMQAGEKLGPYHYHDGVEEWLYVVSGAPILRDVGGERVLQPDELVAFAAGPTGAHTTHGPGRVVMFSAGARGWGEAFLSVYPDSDKIAGKPGVKFRRADAIDAWRSEAAETPSVATWTATSYELKPGEATAAYHYEWCRETWALILGGTPTLRHADGKTTLVRGDICCFPEGPAGAHELRNDGAEPARLILFSTHPGRPMSAFYPDEGTVAIHISDHEGFLFREADQIDYWDGEPGAS